MLMDLCRAETESVMQLRKQMKVDKHCIVKVNCARALVAPLELQVCSGHVGTSDLGIIQSQLGILLQRQTCGGQMLLQTAKVWNGHWNKKLCGKRERVSENV